MLETQAADDLSFHYFYQHLPPHFLNEEIAFFCTRNLKNLNAIIITRNIFFICTAKVDRLCFSILL